MLSGPDRTAVPRGFRTSRYSRQRPALVIRSGNSHGRKHALTWSSRYEWPLQLNLHVSQKAVDDFIQLLGQHEGSEAVRKTEEEFSMTRTATEDDGDFLLEAPHAGISVLFLEGPTVHAISLHSGSKGGFSAFQGSLPGGLDFQSKREDVLRAFGPPTKYRGPFQSSFDPTPSGGWDLYAKDGYSIHIEYDAFTTQIRLVTFQKANQSTTAQRASRVADR
jgi:hypothetical protein